MNGKDHGQCLTDETLTDYLEGNLDAAVRAASEVHLISCERCRDQLAFFMRILQPAVSEEEVAALQTLNVKGLDSAKGSWWNSRWNKPLTAGLAAALFLIGAVSYWFNQQPAQPRSASELVRMLLQEKRPFEARMTGQPYLPIIRTRGLEQPGISYSLLGPEMMRLSASTHEMGRFYLLQRDISRARPYLEMAERETGADAAVHNDLGVVYLESGNAEDLEKAEGEFIHALNENPLLADAAFNLALLYERRSSTALAEAQWKRYLGLDSKSNWAKEARDRLQGMNR